jgi:hypothetical protein
LLGELKSASPTLSVGINVVAPRPGTRWPRGSSRRIRWTLKGESRQTITALVEYSADGGKARTILGRDIKENSLAINTDELPGADHAMVFVQVSDGLHTAEAHSGAFQVALKPPSVRIMTPTTNAEVVGGMPVTLTARGFDRQEVLADSQFQWSSSKDGVLGQGLSLTTSHLSFGDHTIMLRATDQHALTGEDSIQIRVVKQIGPSKTY